MSLKYPSEVSVKPAAGRWDVPFQPWTSHSSGELQAFYSCLGSNLGFFLQTNPTGKCLGTASLAVPHVICPTQYLPFSLSFRS